DMFTTWVNNDLSLQIDDYLSSDGNIYLINSFDNFEKLLAFAEYPDYSFKLTADLDLSTEPNFYIPFLVASFDGNSHTINNLYINQPYINYIGLFGYTDGATITNLGLVDADITGSLNVGGLVGYNYDESTISNSYSTGSVSGSNFVGGLLGFNYGSTLSNSYSAGSVSGSSKVGGLVGYNYESTISNSYSAGCVSGSYKVGGLVGSNSSSSSSISNSYSTSSVTGSSNHVGGLVGYNYESTISNSFWDTQTSGQTNSDGGTGQTTAEMQTLSTFTDAGWDFVGETDNGTEDHWSMLDNSYPELSWELLNNAPVIDYFQPETELEISEEGEVQFSVTASDADNENLNYTWYFDNAEMDETTASYTYFFDTNGVYEVVCEVDDGELSVENSWIITVDITSADNDVEIPQSTELVGNYPNPFNPTTTIRFGLHQDMRVRIDIFNLIGQKIITLLDSEISAGYHSIEWNGENKNGKKVVSGIYYYRMQTDSKNSIKKMLLLK
ncbi:MAG: GLUG motif-containing protein, partial [Candidatus Cloacimonadota bacterium]|nr:GLUG motif-containing protein [Candidatus Cloacimonadota bacterium]